MGTLLEALDEPAFLLTQAGLITEANRAALRLLRHPADPVVGRSVGIFLADPPHHVATLLRRSLGSGQVTIGAVSLQAHGAAPVRLRWRSCRYGDVDGPALLLRLEPADTRRFTTLTEKIVALNAELVRNRRIQHELRTTVAEKEMLLRELNHRVKNNIQMLLGILLLGERRLDDPGAIAILKDVRRRLEAIGVVQRLLYEHASLEGIEGNVFMRDLCASIERGLGRPEIAVEVTDGKVAVSREIASALGLIVNELVTNAFKHAFSPGGRGSIRIGLTGSGPNGLQLTVQDTGRGLKDGGAGGTGLELVRGLAGQLNARVTFESGPGLRCTVSIARPDGSSADPGPQ
jgi:two-component sensor histidine kinase